MKKQVCKEITDEYLGSLNYIKRDIRSTDIYSKIKTNSKKIIKKVFVNM